MEDHVALLVSRRPVDLPLAAGNLHGVTLLDSGDVGGESHGRKGASAAGLDQLLLVLPSVLAVNADHLLPAAGVGVAHGLEHPLGIGVADDRRPGCLLEQPGASEVIGMGVGEVDGLHLGGLASHPLDPLHEAIE
jgi:hypothetical protein